MVYHNLPPLGKIVIKAISVKGNPIIYITFFLNRVILQFNQLYQIVCQIY